MVGLIGTVPATYGGIGAQRPHPRHVQRPADRERAVGTDGCDDHVGHEVRQRIVARAPQVDLERVHAAVGDPVVG